MKDIKKKPLATKTSKGKKTAKVKQNEYIQEDKKKQQ